MPTGQKFGGRKKGTPNKTTAAVKEAILKSFEMVGGEKYLAKIAEEHPQAFCTLLGRCLPKDMNVDMNARMTVSVKDLTGNQ